MMADEEMMADIEYIRSEFAKAAPPKTDAMMADEFPGMTWGEFVDLLDLEIIDDSGRVQVSLDTQFIGYGKERVGHLRKTVAELVLRQCEVAADLSAPGWDEDLTPFLRNLEASLDSALSTVRAHLRLLSRD